MYDIIRITKSSAYSLKERVYRLRKKIYIDEMELKIPTNNEILEDEYDNESTNLLILKDGIDVGTMRITFLKDRSLEILDQQKHWKNLAERYFDDPNTVGEFNRLLVIRNERGSAAAPRLMYHAFLYSIENGVFNIVAAGKTGSLIRNYKKYLGKSVDEKLLSYQIDGFKLGDYNLLHFCFGKPNSVRRLLMRATYGTMNYFICNHLSIYNMLWRRGPGYRNRKILAD